MALQMHAVQIHTNVVGGMSMTEPANDLAIAVAIASSYYEQPIARDIACIGEIGETTSGGDQESTYMLPTQRSFVTFLCSTRAMLLLLLLSTVSAWRDVYPSKLKLLWPSLQNS